MLFTDLVNSTQLMQRAGDEDAQRIFKAHYQLLRDAVSANGGSEVKSLGDGLMVAFSSAADAVRCEIMVQQASRRGVGGERLAVKVGINAGEAMTMSCMPMADHSEQVATDAEQRQLKEEVARLQQEVQALKARASQGQQKEVV